MLFGQFKMWCKPVGACLQASGGKERLSHFPTKMVCPYCLEAVTLREAGYQGHFFIVSCMRWLALLCLALQPIGPDSLLV